MPSWCCHRYGTQRKWWLAIPRHQPLVGMNAMNLRTKCSLAMDRIVHKHLRSPTLPSIALHRSWPKKAGGHLNWEIFPCFIPVWSTNQTINMMISSAAPLPTSPPQMLAFSAAAATPTTIPIASLLPTWGLSNEFRLPEEKASASTCVTNANPCYSVSHQEVFSKCTFTRWNHRMWLQSDTNR